MSTKNSSIIFFFGVLIIGAITNPSYDAHIREVTKAIIPETEIDANDPWGTLGQSLGTKMAGGLLDKYFSVSNYVVLSIGIIKYQGNRKTASIGFLGNVIAFDSNNTIQKNSRQSKKKTTYEDGFRLNDNYKSPKQLNTLKNRSDRQTKMTNDKLSFNNNSKTSVLFKSNEFKVSIEQNYGMASSWYGYVGISISSIDSAVLRGGIALSSW